MPPKTEDAPYLDLIRGAVDRGEWEGLLPDEDRPPLATTPAKATGPAPYVDLIRQADNEDRWHLSAAVELAEGQDPEREARVHRVADVTGITPNFVRNNLDVFEERLQAPGVDIDSMLENSPKLAEFLMRGNAGLAVDDVASLSGLEWAFKSMIAATGYGIRQTEYGGRAFLELQGLGGKENEARIEQLENDVLRRYFGDESWIESGWVEFWKMVPQMIGAAGTGAITALGVGQLGPQVGLPEEIITVPGAAIAGAFSWTYLQEAGFAYQELKKLRDQEGNPLDPTLLYALSNVAGAGNGALELLGATKAIKLVPGGRQMLARIGVGKVKDALRTRGFRQAVSHYAREYGEAAVWESGTEMAQEMVPILARDVERVRADWGDLPICINAAPGDLESALRMAPSPTACSTASCPKLGAEGADFISLKVSSAMRSCSAAPSGSDSVTR